MISFKKAFSSFSTNDIPATKTFYEKLGISVRIDRSMDEMLILELSEDHEVLVYPKEDHQPASFTVLNFPVEDVEKEVDKLIASGIQLEHYAELGTDEKGIAREGDFAVAWFKDPTGNILSILKAM